MSFYDDLGSGNKTPGPVDIKQHFDAMSTRIFEALAVPRDKWVANRVEEDELGPNELVSGSKSIVEEEGGWWCNYTMTLRNGKALLLHMHVRKHRLGKMNTEFADVLLTDQPFDDFIKVVKESIQRKANAS